MDADFLLALRLQQQYDQEEPGHKTSPAPTPAPRGPMPARPPETSVVDPSWELIDPIPDIRALFLQFNDMFFWSKLAGVEVKWSPRMTLCAGVCSYEGRGGLCSVRLSEPLLKLRPRKDLVETLLHEMIHAFLFVTHNNKDHDSHGPEFLKHMQRINSMTGAKISVYHNFHDEVDEYRKHWWLCNGPCQKRKPYFGYVKRAVNRAPSSLDPWWSEHQRTCGGNFIKIKEPENYSQKGKAKESRASNQVNKQSDTKGKCQGVDIRTIIPFSGVGYKLVAPNKGSVPSEVQVVKPFSTDKTKSPQNPSTKTISNHNPFHPNRPSIDKSLGTKKPNVPKISVANTKVFINLNGSPIKLPFSGNKVTTSENALSGKCDIPSFNMTQKKISFGTASSSQTNPSVSQGSSHGQEYGQPSKKPRMDNKELENQTKNAGSNSSIREPFPIFLNGSRESSSSISVSQNIKVNCPVCKIQVYESKINEHLDTCLAAC